MIGSRASNKAVLADALSRHLAGVRPLGDGVWSCSLGDGLPHARARLDASWLTLDAPINGRDAIADPWHLLGFNAQAEAGVKLVLDPASGTTRLLGELPLVLEDPDGLDLSIEVLCGGVRAAAAQWQGSKKKPSRDLPEPPAAKEPSELCRDAGWPFTERDEGRVSVSLEVSRLPYIALIERRRCGQVHISTEVSCLEPSGDQRRHPAPALLLLAATGSVRLARAAAEDQAQGRVVTHLETLLPAEADGEHLHHALAGLSVACGYCGPEAALLQQDHLLCAECLRAWGLEHPRSSNPAA